MKLESLRVPLLAVLALCFVAGCSTDENPITPEKMAEFRQKEQNDRKNFNPNMAPPGQGGQTATK